MSQTHARLGHVSTPPTGTSRYLAFEGAEGAGKSTVAEAVAEHLRAKGETVVTVREPGGTPVGEAVREILLGGELHPEPRSEAALFAAARAQLVAKVVAPALERGEWVLSDRTAYSSLAYQAGGRGLPHDDVFTINDLALGGVWPSMVVLLKVSADRGLGRQSDADRIGAEAKEFHNRVIDAFDQLAAAEPERFVVIDAEQPLSDVISEVISSMESR